MNAQNSALDGLSYSFGIPLSKETGIGALTLGGYLQEVTDRFGAQEAAVSHYGDRVERWTYAELWERSIEVARALIDCGVGKGTRVGVLMTNRLEFLSSVFGIALVGGLVTTVSTFFTLDELDEVLRLSGCSVLLAERYVFKKDFAAMLADIEPQIAESKPGQLASTRFPYLRHIAMVGDDGLGAIEDWQSFLARGETVAVEIVHARASSLHPGDPGTLFFSSGSTGKVKGILGSHRAACLQLWRWKKWYNIDEPPRTWSSNGFFFSGNFCQALGGTLTSGGSLILQRRFAAEEALDLMEKERATMLLAWPHQWAQLQAASNYKKTNLSALHYIDARCPISKHPTIKTNWHEPKSAYGCTETFTLISVFQSGTNEDDIGNSSGLPTAGSIIKIVDPLTGKVVPIGARGEIAVKGPTLMLGYIGIPVEEIFDEEGFFHTNDGGYIDDKGRIFWEGRLNDIIKTGGANVSPLEIDDVIRAYPGVKISQTVGVPDDLLGEIVVSCVVPESGQTLTCDEICKFAREKLASYKVPRRVLFLVEEDLATTGSAKIKTSELRKLAAQRLMTLYAN